MTPTKHFSQINQYSQPTKYCHIDIRNCNIARFCGRIKQLCIPQFLFPCRMIHRVFFYVLIFVLSCLVNGEMSVNETASWHCSRYCNCSLLDDAAIVAKCDLQVMENCESYVLPDDALIL